MAAGAYNVGQLIATLGLDTTQFQAGITKANSSMARTNAMMKTTGANMQKFVTLPLLAASAAAISAQKDFEKSMSKIQGLVGVAGDEVARMGEKVLDLAPAVGRGPTELADALFFVTSAGLRGAEALDVLNQSARASAAGLGETKVIADLVTSAMNAYGSENLNATKATNDLVAAVREGKAEAADMAGAIGAVLPLASEMGVAFDQVGAVFAGMTRTGTDARVASTQLKAIMSSLLKPTQQAEEALNSMGLSSAGLRKQIKDEGLISTLETLRQTSNKYGDDALAKVFPNIRALVGMLDLMGANMESNIAISKRMTDTTGSLDAAFAAASTTTQFKLDQALSEMKVALVALGEVMKNVILPIVSKFAEGMGGLADKLRSLTPEQQKFTGAVIATAAAIGPLLKGFAKISTFAAANPVMAIAIAVAALVIATVKWVKANREVVDGLSGIEFANRQVNKQLAEQTTTVRLLQAQIHNENLSNERRLQAIKDLQKIIPDYNANLTTEGELINENTGAIDAYIAALQEKIRIQVFEEEYTRLLKQQFELQQKIADATVKSVRGGGVVGAAAMANLARLNVQYDKNTQAIKEMDTAAANLNITLGRTPPPGGGTGGGGTGGGGGSTGGGVGTGMANFVGPAISDNFAAMMASKFVDGADQAATAWEAGIGRMKVSMAELNDATIAANTIQVANTALSFQQKMQAANMYTQGAASLASKLTDFSMRNMQKELAAAGKNTKAREEIEKKYAQKQKQWALVNAVINTALAVTSALTVTPPAGYILAAISAAAGAVEIATIASQSFAEGGLVYGPTMGLVGEYPGARSNPEVIAPLSDLQRMLKPQSSGFPKNIEWRIEGRDLVAVIKAEQLHERTY